MGFRSLATKLAARQFAWNRLEQSHQAIPSGQAASNQQQRQTRMRGRRHRGCRGGERRKKTRKDHGSNSERSGRSPSSSSPLPSWRRPDEPEICYIDRTLDTDQREAAYEYLAVLIQITSMRPPITPEQARTAIAGKYGIRLDEHLEIHVAVAPFDFFLILPDHASYLTVLNSDKTVQTPAFTLSIKPWNRLV